jgi:hypothetical protein
MPLSAQMRVVGEGQNIFSYLSSAFRDRDFPPHTWAYLWAPLPVCISLGLSTPNPQPPPSRVCFNFPRICQGMASWHATQRVSEKACEYPHWTEHSKASDTTKRSERGAYLERKNIRCLQTQLHKYSAIQYSTPA